MDNRRRIAMRRLVDETIRQINAGTVRPDQAARALHGAGVPFSVIGRVIANAGNLHRWTDLPAGRDTKRHAA